MYYLRSRAAADAIKFTVDTSALEVWKVHYNQMFHFFLFFFSFFVVFKLLRKISVANVGNSKGGGQRRGRWWNQDGTNGVFSDKPWRVFGLWKLRRYYIWKWHHLNIRVLPFDHYKNGSTTSEDLRDLIQ